MPHRLKRRCFIINVQSAPERFWCIAGFLVRNEVFLASISFLCESHRPFCLSRPATASTTAAKRELPLANPMGQLNTSDRDGRVLERFESGHRRTAPLDGSMILLDEVVEILAGAHFDVTPARMLSAQQPQRTTARHMTVERHFARHARSVGRERLAKERLGGRDSAVAAK